MISLGFDADLYPAGTHMCRIFNDDEERRRVMAKFIQSGIDENELLRYFGPGPTLASRGSWRSARSATTS